ncbi:MAG: protein kinase [Polyangiales bacterium]
MTDIRDPLIGSRIDDRYLVHGVLGRGGMGVVYEGVHEQLGRPVAIKVLGPGIASDPTAVQRFLREARTASQLTHGNIVDVSDLGALPDGRPYLVMARLDGRDLNTLLREKGPQTPKRTAQLLQGAAAALDLIHAKGYVHRDVKPENLMHVVREDGSEAVLLLDFGIVGLVSQDTVRLTADGVVFGTPVYLAPEVIRGGTPSPRSDTYALATVAFELITGQPPFSVANALQLMQSKLVDDPPRLSLIAGVDIPESVEVVLATGLERDPGRRYGTAGAFISALDAATQGGMSTAALPALQAARKHGHLPTATLSMKPSFDAGVDSRVQGTTKPEVQPLALQPTVASSPPSIPSVPRSRKLPVTIGVVSLLGVLVIVFYGIQGATPALRSEVHSGPVPTVSPLPSNLPPSAATPPDAPTPSPPPPPTSTPAPASSTELPLGAAAPSPPAKEPLKRSERTTSRAGNGTRTVDPGPDRKRDNKRKPEQAGWPEATPLNVEASTNPPSPEPPPVPAAAPAGPTAAPFVEQAQRELAAGHLGAAIDLYTRATALDANNTAAFRGLGLVYERLGRQADAARALRRAVELTPGGESKKLLEERLRKLEAQP